MSDSLPKLKALGLVLILAAMLSACQDNGDGPAPQFRVSDWTGNVKPLRVIRADATGECFLESWDGLTNASRELCDAVFGTNQATK